jgi:hypothetical protein
VFLQKEATKFKTIVRLQRSLKRAGELRGGIEANFVLFVDYFI